MAELSQQMLAAARVSDWDRLIELAQAREQIEADLRQTDTMPWQPALALKKKNFINTILTADQEIKTLAESWLGGLQDTIGSLSMEKKLMKTYQTP